MQNPVIVKSLLEAVIQYDRMLPSTRKILQDVFIPMYKWCEEIYPRHSTIAKKAGLGTTQVKKAIKQAVELGVLIAEKKGGRRSLTYTVNKHFAEACILIKACRFSYNWKKHREEVIQKVAEDDFFFAKLLKKRGCLSTKAVTSSLLCKVSTILALLSSESSVRVRVEEPPAFREQANQQRRNPTPIQEGSPYLWGLKIKQRDVETLTFMNSPQELKKAREIFDFMRHKKDIFIRNPAAFIISQIKKGRGNQTRAALR
jgi:hypothetical protein